MKISVDLLIILISLAFLMGLLVNVVHTIVFKTIITEIEARQICEALYRDFPNKPKEEQTRLVWLVSVIVKKWFSIQEKNSVRDFD